MFHVSVILSVHKKAMLLSDVSCGIDAMAQYSPLRRVPGGSQEMDAWNLEDSFEGRPDYVMVSGRGGSLSR